MSEARLSNATFNRAAQRRALFVTLVLLVGTGMLWGVARAMKLVLVKPPAPLTKPLPELAATFGPYVADGHDQKLQPDVEETLETKDYLMRRYRDTRKRENELGAFISLNLNYYATGSASPHVPDVCWVGSGAKREADGMFEVDGVPHLEGPPSTIRLRRVSFTPIARNPSQLSLMDVSEVARTINVAYVFQVNGSYVSTVEEVSKHFWSPKAKYAYHAKIELTLTDADGTPLSCESKEAEALFADFLRAALPSIEECLPDPKKLVETAAPAATQSQVVR